jgi:hypothetical protein
VTEFELPEALREQHDLREFELPEALREYHG